MKVFPDIFEEAFQNKKNQIIICAQESTSLITKQWVVKK